jgi:hypothetical protein
VIVYGKRLLYENSNDSQRRKAGCKTSEQKRIWKTVATKIKEIIAVRNGQQIRKGGWDISIEKGLLKIIPICLLSWTLAK